MSKSVLKDRLEPYELDTPAQLAKRYPCTEGYASRLLSGEAYGVNTAKKLARLIGQPWEVVVTWQTDGKKRK